MGSSTGRRQFLGRAIGMGLAPGLVGGLAFGREPVAPREAPIPIVDSHQHLWDLRRFRLPWLAAGSDLDRNFLTEDYQKAAEGLGIVQTIYVEVDVPPEQHRAEADYVADLCRRRVGGLAGAVVGGRPDSDDFGDYLAYIGAKPEIKGVRQVLHGGTPAGFCLRPNFVRGIRLLGEKGLNFDLCMRSDGLRDATALVDACPGTTFILDHCGNPDVGGKGREDWKADLAAMAGRKNVSCKVSGFIGSAQPGWKPADVAPIIDHVLDSFGPDRVMFAGDWPVCMKAATLRQWTEAVQEIVRGRPEADRRKLFADNARKIYRLA